MNIAEIKVEGNDYRFTNEGFQTKETKGNIGYDKIIAIKKDISDNLYCIKYRNDKDRKLEISIYAENTDTYNIDKILKSNSMESIVRNRTIIESGQSWFWLFGIVAFINIVTVYLMIGDVDSVRLPIILIPFIKLGFKIGLRNIILITIATSIVSIFGTILSYIKKKQIEIFTRKNNV